VEIRSKALGAIIAIVIFGGIMGATALGLWNTESVRNPAKLQISESIGNVAGENVGTGTGTYDPADIRGNPSIQPPSKTRISNPSIPNSMGSRKSATAR